jgi:diaminohydroxyphosphoribosylaminopyrimidine deaminase / 5-amino-6-(5-phosphoribosylamino)uracil reductase
MEQALRVARRAQGRSSPNPPVGAVVVRDDHLLGEGWTQPPGGSHAEVVALQHAGASAQGADLYVTLEPCTFWGRTPPCTDAITQAGIRRVFFAAHDPDRRIGAGAAAVLASAGVQAQYCSEYAAPAQELIAPFRCWTLHRRPLLIAKYAMTLDGRIATATGDSRWISSPAARRRVHELRDTVDAIMVGVGTVLADDPQLTTRLESHWRPVQHPLRVIVDSRGRTPLDARILDPDLPGHTLIVTSRRDPEWQRLLGARGVDVQHFDPATDGRVPLPALMQMLAERGCTSVLAEGGSTLLGALAQERLIDRIWAFIAPKIVGGSAALGPVGDRGAAFMADAQRWDFGALERIGDDLLIIAHPRANESNEAETPHTTPDLRARS